MLAGVWVVLRSPGSRDAQLFFVAFSLLSIFMLPLQSPEPWLPRLHQAVFGVGGSVAFTAILLCSLSFPPGIPPEKRLSPWWASIGLLHGVVRVGYWIEGDFPREVVPKLALSVDLLFIVVGIGVIARNDRYAEPAARRRVRWVVLATGGWTLLTGAAAFADVVATDATDLDFPALVVISGLAAALVPVAVVVSVVRYNLFDIHRLLSATAAYSLALIVAAAAAIGATSWIGAPLAASLGMSPVVTQSSLLVVLAAVSHDLRQPLHAIGLLSETLEGQIAGSKGQATLSKIRGATTALADRIASLLDLSRLEAGTLLPEVGDVALDALLLGVVDEFDEVARRKHLQLRLDASSAVVRTDALMLGRIVRNLLSNELRYTDKGGVTISAVDAGGGVELRVSDTGPGIPLERQGAIFDEFVRLETGGEGLGLGLAIV